MSIESTEPGSLTGNITTMLRQADAALRDGGLAEAETLYRQALRLRPTSAQAMSGLATVASRRGELPDALRWREAVRDLRPDSADAWTRLGDALRALRRTADAEEAYRRAAALKAGDPRAVRALLGLAACALERGDRDAALAAWAWAAEAALTHDASLKQVAKALRGAREHDHAAAVFARLVRARPDSVEAGLALGFAERARGRREAARDAFRQLLAIWPENIPALVEAATEERALGRLEEATALLRRALGQEPDHRSALRQLVEVVVASEGSAAAIGWLRAESAARPESRAVRLFLAQLLADAGEPADALTALDAGVADGAEDMEFRLKRIGLLRRLGYWPRARALAREAVALDPDSVPAWQRCVELEIALGGWAETERLLASPPGRAAPGLCHRLRGLLAMARWRPGEAAEQFLQALACDPDDAAAHHQLARARLAEVAPDAAMSHVRAWARSRSASAVKPR